MHGFPVGFAYPANAAILGQSGSRNNPIQNTISYAIIKACIMGDMNDDGSRSFLRFEKKDWGESLLFPPVFLIPLTSLADVNVLNYKVNDSLVFDAAGECILRLHSHEDMMMAKGHHVSLSMSKKPPSTPVKKAIVRPKKRTRVISDDEDDMDQPLVKRAKQKTHLLDQSTEG
jgi:hypothetical protein